MPRLIINADDYGISPERDQGIHDCFHGNSITSASFLLSGLSAPLFPLAPISSQIPLGLHLNLTEGEPIAGAQNVPSLVGADGRMLGKHGFREKVKSGHVVLQEVEREIVAQVARFREIVGKDPTHMDSHQHVHVLPELVELIAEVVTRPECGITKMRCPEEDLFQYPWFAQSPSRGFYETVALQAGLARRKYEQRGIKFPDRFVGNALFGTNNSVDLFIHVIQQIGPEETVEFMCHPGYRSTTWDDFNQSSDREHEMAVLCDPRVKEALSRCNVTLCNFADL